MANTEVQRDNLKSIMRNELPQTFNKGAVESIIGLTDINYGLNIDSDSRITNLENNETIYQVFSYVGTSASGQIPVYEESSIFDIYGDGLVDAIVVKADGNQNPIEEFATNSVGDQITVTSLIDNLNNTANYILSDTPAQNACIIYFLKIKDQYKANIPEDNIIPPVIRVKSGPTSIVTVANTGGDFTSIGDALDSITDNSSSNQYSISVAPGTYIENNPIQCKEFVSIRSDGGSFVTSIVAQNANENMFDLAPFVVIRGLNVTGIIGTGYAFNIEISGNASLLDCISNECSNGICINNSGAFVNIFNHGEVNSVVTTTYSLRIISGNVCVNSYIIANSSSVTTGVSVDGIDSVLTLNNFLTFSSNIGTGLMFTGGCRVFGAVNNITGVYDGVVIEGVNTNVRFDALKIFNCQNDGVRINDVGTGIELALFSTTITGCTRYNFNILNPNCVASGNGFTELEKSNVVSGAQLYAYLLDIVSGDEGLNIMGELHVGRPMAPAESVLGGGDSHTYMYVYTYNGSVFTDRTEEAKSFSGSTFQFDGVGVGNAIYIANRYPMTFEGIKISIVSAAVMGTGEIIAEYWNGSSWEEFNACTVLSSTPYLKYSKNYFAQEGNYHIKYDPFIIDNWITNDPVIPVIGTNLYWVRFRVVTAIITSPVIQQIKIHTSRAEINGDGTFESHMDARVYKKLVVDAVKPIEGSMQDADIYVDENVGVGLDNNRFTAVGDMLGVSFELPEDCDTSAPLILVWKGKFASIGSAQFTIRLKVVRPGDAYTNSEPAPSGEVITVITPLTTISAVNTRYDFRADIDISGAIPSRSGSFGDELWITIQNTTRSGDFDYTKISANYLSDFAGRHVRQ